MPVFYSFFDHGCPNNTDKREDVTGSLERSQASEGQDGNNQEVEVSHSSELLKQGFGQESCSSVLCSPNIIPRITILDFTLKTFCLIAIYHS